ncbi:hypothetical protein LBO01_18170 [Companilactobacillus paralimentarius]|uniref:Uncharacterized protein n=1 Tax=Companilactobacillus bobalius TaxID=2801451 RepID=A0A202F366_9LACO|nr:hypothetical protein LKACC16343_02782 [Companilactobacillus bobalius]GEO58688.1 hypothetical protein LBO01_18170 [Companilactobacillus paralimentarius]
MMKDWIDRGFGNMKVGNLVRLHISSKERLEFSLVHGCTDNLYINDHLHY